ncbi:MAG: hypothetical protein ACLFQK_12265 [Fibrobacterota bacterium]
MKIPAAALLAVFLSCSVFDEVNVSNAALSLAGTNPYDIYDGSANGTDGNEDGKLSAGESAAIQLKAVNDGTEDAYDVIMTVNASGSHVSVVEGASQTLGDMVKGVNVYTAAANTSNSILLKASSATPAGHIAEFAVTFRDKRGNKWNDSFTLVVNPPAASIQLYGSNPYDIFDGTAAGADGNGDGELNPGETVRVQLRFTNAGSVDALQVVMEASTLDTSVSVVDDSTYTFGDMKAYETYYTPDADVTSALMLKADSTATVGHTAEIDVECTDKFGNAWTDRFDIIVR